MEKVVIASMGVEGGGETLFGRHVDGAWSFWREGASMNIDDEGNESWPGWSSQPASDLLAALPEDKKRKRFFLLHLYKVHPAFSDQLRSAYEQNVGPSNWREGWWDELLVAYERHHS